MQFHFHGDLASEIELITDPDSIKSSANTTCIQPTEAASSNVTFSIDPADQACAEIDLTIKGGLAPYTISLIAP